MKYLVLIIDGAAGLPIRERGGKTCLELAETPNLDILASEGSGGLVRTVPDGMEPSSACACMSLLGYDPKVYYKGRASIEARSMGIGIGPDDVVFRCNLVNVGGGRMVDYSAGHITTAEAAGLIRTLDEKLGSEEIRFYPGVSYRHILKLKGRQDALNAVCTPPHDIPERPVKDYLPKGEGSEILNDLMIRAGVELEKHPVNADRISRGQLPATDIWLFWGSSRLPPMPSFRDVYGLGAAMTSGVDLLKGLAGLAGMAVLDIKGVTDGPDNDNAAQAGGALDALSKFDLVVVHIESPDEAGHSGSVEAKVSAIEAIDKEVVGHFLQYPGDLRVLVMPDHPTPVAVRTHTPEPVPFLIWGKGIKSGGMKRFTEAGAESTGVLLEDGYKIMSKFIGGF